jgi:hypothetical protein
MKSVNDLPNVGDFQPKLQFPQDTPVLEFTPRFPMGILFWFLEATVVQLPLSTQFYFHTRCIKIYRSVPLSYPYSE